MMCSITQSVYIRSFEREDYDNYGFLFESLSDSLEIYPMVT